MGLVEPAGIISSIRSPSDQDAAFEDPGLINDVSSCDRICSMEKIHDK